MVNRRQIFIIFLFISGCVRFVSHDPEKAIDSCNHFLKSIIKEEYSSAYSYTADCFKKEFSFGQFELDLENSKKVRGAIRKAVFDSYQIVLHQRAIQLYYFVDHKEAGDVLYHFVLEGDRESGYRIFFVDIGNQVKYPSGVVYINEPRKQKLDKRIEVNGD